MKKSVADMTNLICLECGSAFPLFRRTNRQKTTGHIKDLWCIKCEKITKHYEVKNIDIFLFPDYQDDEVKQYIKGLITNNQEVDYEKRDRVFKKILKK